MLAKTNAHPRDKHIKYHSLPNGGGYYVLEIDGKQVRPTRTTSLIHRFFSPFDADKIIDRMIVSGSAAQNYPGKSRQEIKDEWSNSATLGTLLHEDIERYLNEEPILEPDNAEFKMFLNFWSDFTQKYPSFKVYRTEWLIYNEDLPLSGSIDCTVVTEDGDFILIDWKRSKGIKTENKYQKGFGVCKDLDDCNYSHYSLQLNIYRRILEEKYNANVVFMMLAVFTPGKDSYLTYPIERNDSVVDELWKSLK